MNHMTMMRAAKKSHRADRIAADRETAPVVIDLDEPTFHHASDPSSDAIVLSDSDYEPPEDDDEADESDIELYEIDPVEIEALNVKYAYEEIMQSSAAW